MNAAAPIAFVTPIVRRVLRHNARWSYAIGNGSWNCLRAPVVQRQPAVSVQIGVTKSLASSSPSPSPPGAEQVKKNNAESSERYLFDKGYRHGDRVLLFDGVCVLCNSGVDLVLRFDNAGVFKFAALQSDVGRALLTKYQAPDDLSTVVFIDGVEAHIRSEAVLRVGKYLPWYFSLPSQAALIVIPKRLRDWMYSDLLAKNRYSLFGKRDHCRLVDKTNKSRFLL